MAKGKFDFRKLLKKEESKVEMKGHKRPYFEVPPNFGAKIESLRR